MFIELKDTKNLLNLIYVCDCTCADNVVSYVLTNGSLVKEVLSSDTEAQNRVEEIKNMQWSSGGGSGSNLQGKDITITENGITTIQPDSGYDGLSDVTVTVSVEASFKVPNGLKFAYSTLTALPNVDTSNVTDMNSMFSGCTSLTMIPQLDTSNVTSMSSMFQNCTSLTMIPKLDTNNVTDMGYMFSSCTSLNVLPQLDTSNVTNMQNFCYDCSNLVGIPQLNLSSVYEGNMLSRQGSSLFTGCTSLSDDSLNNILASCLTMQKLHYSHKTLKYIGLTQAQAETCMTLSNYQAFLDAGWTTGY